MRVFEQADDQSKNNKNTPEQIQNTPRQQQTQDALALAEAIYDIFRYNPSNTKITATISKDEKNV